jgi:hypothetical protein
MTDAADQIVNQPENDQDFLNSLEAVLGKLLDAQLPALEQSITSKFEARLKAVETAKPAVPAKAGKAKSADDERIARLEQALRKSNIQNLLSNAKEELGLDPDLLAPYLATLEFDNDLVMADGTILGQHLAQFAETDIGKKYLIPQQTQQPVRPGYNAGLTNSQMTQEFPYAQLFQF